MAVPWMCQWPWSEAVTGQLSIGPRSTGGLSRGPFPSARVPQSRECRERGKSWRACGSWETFKGAWGTLPLPCPKPPFNPQGGGS
nr:hypothetical protein CFP56_12349 [Quercus suber]